MVILTTALTTQQAARKLGVTRSRVLQLVLAGRLRTQRFGVAHMIREADLLKFRRLRRGRPRGAGGSRETEVGSQKVEGGMADARR